MRRFDKFHILFWAAAAAVLSTIAVSVLKCPAQAAQQFQTPGEDVREPAEIVEIYTYEDLAQVAENPAGSYRLMSHIDMEGLKWEPVDFSGVFDGNGYSLLNLEVNSTGEGTADTYDGNYKVYDTCFGGFFGILKEAEVLNLSLVNVKVQVETDQPCFIGSIAGYSENSAVRGCHVRGRLELRAHDRMFGVGGIIGYGNGLIEETSADVTLICTDTDAATRDEQFMGGAYAAGYMDLNKCTVTIDGYDSDHGYVHDGGLVGMYIFYPRGLQYKGRVTGNKVSGMITFFEDNTNRRAYCKEYIGEIMNWDFTNSGNSHSFTRNEIFEYSVDLKPDMCVDAARTETVTEPGCDSFGYTAITCEGCGYTYTDHYTLYRHDEIDWKITKEPTVQDTGVRTGVCALCGEIFEEELAKLEPVEAETTVESSAVETDRSTPGNDAGEESAAVSGSSGGRELSSPQKMIGIGVLAALALALILGEALIFRGRKKR